MSKKIILWLAQGFGSGRAPVAPGTFGSVVGLGWLAILLLGQSWWILGCGIAVSIIVSVWLCGEGEKIMNQKDPGPVVMDEIIAMPLCFVAWLAMIHPTLPSPVEFFKNHWPVVLVVFVLFRLFDIWKPWPVRQSQSLRGGLGITIDDVLAAVYVNLVMLVYMSCTSLLQTHSR